MSFKKQSDSSSVWVPPSKDEVARRLDELVNPQLSNEIEVPIEELQGQIAAAVGSLLPKVDSFSGKKEKLYNAVLSTVSKERAPADIILPVYNSIHIVEKCIQSVLSRTNWPFRLIIVDDASDEMTKTILAQYAEKDSRISIITNPKNKGFSATVNRGIAAGRGKYIVLLNSDVLVTPGWLTKIIFALEADPRNQIVNPVTNNTALINVPMSPGASYLDMNWILQNRGEVKYPEIMPTGFVFAFRRSLLSETGPLDESYFNYGEETDFWMKTITYRRGPIVRGYRAVLADDTYVFHERGSSFSSLGEEKHMGFRRHAADRFNRVWPQFGQWKKTFHLDTALGHIKATIPNSLLNSYRKVPYRVCWIVRSAAYPCGGMEYITDITNEMIERGIDARVAVVGRNSQSKPLEPNGELRCGVINFESDEDFIKNFTSKVFKNGIVIAATAELAPIVHSLAEVERKIKPVLHAQSYEPDLLGETHPAYETYKNNFKLLPMVISSSHWITKKLIENGVNVVSTVSPGVDRKMFYTGDRSKGDERLTVMMPMSSIYPYKGYDRGVALLQQLYNKSIMAKMTIRLMTYGVDSIPEICGTAIALGPIPQTRLAKILREEVDVFIDPSYNHSYGMPCIEAMASGVPVICWDNKGIGEYVKHGKNGLKLPNSMSPVEVADSILNLLRDEETRGKLRENALNSLESQDRTQSVNEFIESLEKSLSLKRTKRRIVFITPHLRKHGGPTTILSLANALSDRGHDVSITSVYPDVVPEVLSFTDLPINLNHRDVPDCDVLIVNSDSDISQFFFDLPQAKKKIMLKLSHNARFKEFEEASLNLKWDKIITSTGWLANVCRNPLPGWNNSPVAATRIGWFHYGHDTFKTPPSVKKFRQGTPEEPIRICTLIHPYPLKGTNDAMQALRVIKANFGDCVRIECVGEYPKNNLSLPSWIKYHDSLSRQSMSDLFKNTDIWIGASHTEGLGRMALEVMSSCVACVLTDAHTEFTEHDKNCLLVPISRPDLIVKSIETLLADRSKMIKLAFEGYRTAELHTDPTDCIDNLEKAIEEIMGQ